MKKAITALGLFASAFSYADQRCHLRGNGEVLEINVYDMSDDTVDVLVQRHGGGSHRFYEVSSSPLSATAGEVSFELFLDANNGWEVTGGYINDGSAGLQCAGNGVGLPF